MIVTKDKTDQSSWTEPQLFSYLYCSQNLDKNIFSNLEHYMVGDLISLVSV